MNQFNRRWMQYSIIGTLIVGVYLYLQLTEVVESYMLLLSIDSALAVTMYWQLVKVYGTILTALGILLGFSGVCLSLAIQRFMNLEEKELKDVSPEIGKARKTAIAALHKEFIAFAKAYLFFHIIVLSISILQYTEMLLPMISKLVEYSIVVMLFFITLMGFFVLVFSAFGVWEISIDTQC